ncbi:MAG: glycerate kinase [Hespellia sp.]|jgi:glycerate kinase|nr:glycerate kinase [Hespellia sp.]
MKVVIAIDSFKGSLSSVEAGNTIRSAVLSVKPEADVVVKPLADGGEGTTDSLIDGLGGKKVRLTVTGPLGASVSTYYGCLETENTVILEMASAAGIMLVSEEEKNPMRATTLGVGEMIRHAIEQGYRKFIVGIGGSATNDGGIGMLKALGYEFLDENGADAGEGGQALAKIKSIRTKNIHPLLKMCDFQIACDVKNPLCGENGATYIYGPQKGVTETLREPLDQGMRNYARVVTETFSSRFENVEGAGAAGGLGYAFLSFLNGKLTPGIELVLDAVGLETEIKNADVVVTGEGRLDHQTAMGKAPIGVAKLAKKYGAKVVAFAGSVTEDAGACNAEGIDAFFPIVRGITTLEEAMRPDCAKANLFAAAEQVFRLL